MGEKVYENLFKKHEEPKVAWYHGRDLISRLTVNTSPSDIFYTAAAFLAEQAVQLGSTMEIFEQDGNYRLVAGAHKKLVELIKSFPGAREVVKNFYTGNLERYSTAIVWDDGAAYYNEPDEVPAEKKESEPEESDSIIDDLLDDDEDSIEVESPEGDNDEFVMLAIATRNHLHMESIRKFVKEHLAPVRVVVHKKPGTAYILANVPMQGLQLVSMGIAGEDIIRENYSSEVCAQYDIAVEDLTSPTPRGRLVILEGEPGCGKTHMVQALMRSAGQARFVIVPPKLLKDLEDPGFILTFVQQKFNGNSSLPLVLVLEDADQCLTERNMDNISSISAILNLSDGIVGKLLNLRIVATTNTPIAKDGKRMFDKAALRKGRLSAHIQVGPLEREQANAVFRRLTGSEITGFKSGANIPLGDVYDAANAWLEKNPTEVTKQLIKELKK